MSDRGELCEWRPVREWRELEAENARLREALVWVLKDYERMTDRFLADSEYQRPCGNARLRIKKAHEALRESSDE